MGHIANADLVAPCVFVWFVVAEYCALKLVLKLALKSVLKLFLRMVLKSAL